MANPVSIRLDDVTKARLEGAARAQERSVSYVAKKAIVAWLDAQDRKTREIAEAVVAFEHETHFISGEAVDAWVESWTDGKDSPPPKPDLVIRKKR